MTEQIFRLDKWSPLPGLGLANIAYDRGGLAEQIGFASIFADTRLPYILGQGHANVVAFTSRWAAGSFQGDPDIKSRQSGFARCGWGTEASSFSIDAYVGGRPGRRRFRR